MRLIEFSDDIVKIENYGECKDSILEQFIELENKKQGKIIILEEPNKYCPNIKYSCCSERNIHYFS